MKTRLALCAVAILWPALAQAHFIWIVPAENDGQHVKVLFSDSLEADKIFGKRIDHVARTKFWMSDATGKSEPLKLLKGSEGHGLLNVSGKGCRVIGGKCRWGVHILKERNETTPFLIYYYPKLVLNHGGAEQLGKSYKQLAAEIVPAVDKDYLRLRVLFKGKPVPKTDVHVLYPDGKRGAYRTKSRGTLRLPSRGAGTYALWARCAVEPIAGEDMGRRFDEIRHYATLVFTVRDADIGK